MANWTTRRFDEIAIGDSASYSRTLAAADIELVAMLTGDRMGAGQTARPGGALSTHSIGASVLLATAVGTQLPGPGAKILEESLRFNGRVTVNDVLTAKITVREKRIKERQLVLDAGCTNQKGETVAEGSMRVECPEQSYTVPRMAEVDIAFRRYNAFQTIFELCEGKAAVTTAVVHPCDEVSLRGAVESGPDAKIRAAAKDAGVSLDGVKIVVTEHSHAAADRAVAMARAGEVEALMKGSLHTDELMSAVIDPANGLRTARRVSHVFVMDVPTYPKPLLITDAAINIYPDLDTKRDICQNAIDLAHVLRVKRPKVAILSAVETVNPKMQGTVDAAALCKMADRGQITGGILDGPLAFDNAISAAAARIKQIDSPVAGDPDILVAPDLEAGNLLAKTLAYLAAAESAGVVLGARVPIVLTSRADSARNREASAAVMALLAHSRRDKLGVR